MLRYLSAYLVALFLLMAGASSASAMARECTCPQGHSSRVLVQHVHRHHHRATPKGYAHAVLVQHHQGWAFGCLVIIWEHESGWNPYAVNRSSGAYGIPQANGHGHPYNLGDFKAQIMWGLRYIWGRYGTPCGAWSFWQAHGWY